MKRLFFELQINSLFKNNRPIFTCLQKSCSSCFFQIYNSSFSDRNYPFFGKNRFNFWLLFFVNWNFRAAAWLCEEECKTVFSLYTAFGWSSHCCCNLRDRCCEQVELSSLADLEDIALVLFLDTFLLAESSRRINLINA